MIPQIGGAPAGKHNENQSAIQLDYHTHAFRSSSKPSESSWAASSPTIKFRALLLAVEIGHRTTRRATAMAILPTRRAALDWGAYHFAVGKSIFLSGCAACAGSSSSLVHFLRFFFSSFWTPTLRALLKASAIYLAAVAAPKTSLRLVPAFVLALNPELTRVFCFSLCPGLIGLFSLSTKNDLFFRCLCRAPHTRTRRSFFS